MTAYSGSALVVNWVMTSGTVTLATDYQTLSYTPSIDMIETTAGADTSKEYIIGMRDAAIAYTGIHQTDGTAVWISNLDEGTQGTLTISPRGTATGNQKMVIPAMSQGITWNWSYNDKVLVNINWMQTGPRSGTAW